MSTYYLSAGRDECDLVLAFLPRTCIRLGTLKGKESTNVLLVASILKPYFIIFEPIITYKFYPRLLFTLLNNYNILSLSDLVLPVIAINLYGVN
jgi:hypothetical protein